MEKKRFAFAHSFVWALTLTLLLSLTTGIIVWAKGPPIPPPPPPTYEFHIWIGEVDNDVVLVNPPLTVEAYVDTCGWYYPYKKGTTGGGWSADLNSLWPSDSDDICGSYIVSLRDENVPNEIDAQTFSISHEWGKPRRYDFWQLYIGWGWNMANPTDYSNIRILRVWTDRDFDPDGTYDSVNEVWEVDFNGASWELVGFNSDGTGYHMTDGTILNGFTVTIDKLPEAS